jgi:hypothetical protein
MRSGTTNEEGKAWSSACEVASRKVGELCKRLQKDVEGGLMVNTKQLDFLARLRDALFGAKDMTAGDRETLWRLCGVREMFDAPEGGGSGGVTPIKGRH